MKERRVAIVGAGVMGRLHARAIARRAERFADCRLALVIDRHPDRAERVTEEFGGQSVEPGDVDWSEIDAAVVATPTLGHAEVARGLMGRGLDVLIEKPMALDVAEAQGLAGLAEESGCILQVGHTEWYNAAWRRAIDRAGSPRSIEVERLAPRSDRGLDIDVVQDFMLHDLDWISRIVGDELVALEARGRAIHDSAIDEAEVELRFATGCTARLRASRVHPEPLRRVRIEGAEGVAEADLFAAPPAGEERGGEVEPLDAQWADFLHACAARKAPANDARVGVSAVELVERVRSAIGVGTEGAGDADDHALGR